MSLYRFAVVRLAPVLGLLLVAARPSMGAAQSLAVTGTCPGEVTFEATGLPSRGGFALFSASGVGDGLIDARVCEGWPSGLAADRQRRAAGDADVEGIFSTTVTLPEAACGACVRGLVRSGCGLTNPVGLLGPCLEEGFEGDWPGDWLPIPVEYGYGSGTLVPDGHSGAWAVRGPGWHRASGPLLEEGDTIRVWAKLDFSFYYDSYITVGFGADWWGTYAVTVTTDAWGMGRLTFYKLDDYERAVVLTGGDPVSFEVPLWDWIRVDVVLNADGYVGARVYDAKGALLIEESAVLDHDHEGGLAAIAGGYQTKIDDFSVLCCR
jgi:hypothetical protein